MTGWSLFLTCIAFSLFSTSALAAPDYGLFMVVKGPVRVLSATDKKETIAKVGAKVFSGDTVITGTDARAKIVMSDRNVLQLSPDSTLEIARYKTGATENDREAQVALMQGKVRVQVEQTYGEKNKFELRTPTAVAGVRGTQYIAQYDQSSRSTTITVLQGRVAVSSASQSAPPVILSPNTSTTVKENTAPTAPLKLSPNQVNEMMNSASTSPENISAPEEKSLVTSDMVGGEALSSDSSLQNAMERPSTNPAPPATVPQVNVPQAPATNPLVNEVIQNKNSKSRVIITPRPQQ
ncbi:MAG: FecR domain-containing protein [Bdellovibrio sp.]